MSLFRRACLRYPFKKSLGPDGWRACELAALPAPLLSLVVTALNLCVSRGTWPSFMCTSFMALLPKPSGGYRTIAKTCLLYRLWAAARRPDIRSWEKSIALPQDTAVPGSSALSAALRRSLDVEVAATLGRSSLAIFGTSPSFSTRLSLSSLSTAPLS